MLLRLLLCRDFLGSGFFYRLSRNRLLQLNRLLVAFLDSGALLLRLFYLPDFLIRCLHLLCSLFLCYRCLCSRSLLYRRLSFLLFRLLFSTLFRLLCRRFSLFCRSIWSYLCFIILYSSFFCRFLYRLLHRFFCSLLCSLLFLRSAALLPLWLLRGILSVDSRFMIKNRIDQIILLHFLESFYF